MSAWFAALIIVGDDQGILVEHGALEARIGAHVDTDLFTQPAGIAVSGETIEEYPECFPVAEIETDKTGAQVVDRAKITHEGKPGP